MSAQLDMFQKPAPPIPVRCHWITAEAGKWVDGACKTCGGTMRRMLWICRELGSFCTACRASEDCPTYPYVCTHIADKFTNELTGVA